MYLNLEHNVIYFWDFDDISILYDIFRSLQVKLDKPISEPESPRTLNDFNYGSGDTAANLANNIRALKQVRFVEEY